MSPKIPLRIASLLTGICIAAGLPLKPAGGTARQAPPG